MVSCVVKCSHVRSQVWSHVQPGQRLGVSSRKVSPWGIAFKEEVELMLGVAKCIHHYKKKHLNILHRLACVRCIDRVWRSRMTRQLQSTSNLTITLSINCFGLASITTGWPIKSSLAVSVFAVVLFMDICVKYNTAQHKQTSMSIVMERLPVVLDTQRN